MKKAILTESQKAIKNKYDEVATVVKNAKSALIGNRTEIVHKRRRVLEDTLIYSLQNVASLFTVFFGNKKVSIIYMSASVAFTFNGVALDFEAVENFVK